MGDLRQNPGNSNLDIFTYEEMRLATKRFRPDLVLGEGGFGVVYKGVIDDNVRPGYKTTQVAIKELNPEGYQGDREWLVSIYLTYLLSKYAYLVVRVVSVEAFSFFLLLQAEVNYLGQVRHDNLVKLIGYCCEDHHRLLVYEYMASGSLEKHLFRSKWMIQLPIFCCYRKLRAYFRLYYYSSTMQGVHSINFRQNSSL